MKKCAQQLEELNNDVIFFSISENGDLNGYVSKHLKCWFKIDTELLSKGVKETFIQKRMKMKNVCKKEDKEIEKCYNNQMLKILT